MNVDSEISSASYASLFQEEHLLHRKHQGSILKVSTVVAIQNQMKHHMP